MEPIQPIQPTRRQKPPLVAPPPAYGHKIVYSTH